MPDPATIPAFTGDGKELAAGEAPRFKLAEATTSGPVDSIGAPLVAPRARPPRACARCGRRFKPKHGEAMGVVLVVLSELRRNRRMRAT